MAKPLDSSSDEAFSKLVAEIQRCGHFKDPALLDSRNVYGRICLEKEAPQCLANANDRKTVFLFGEDAITSIILRRTTYDSLIELGMIPEYIRYKILEQKKSQCYLVLFKLREETKDKFDVYPATWDGIEKMIEKNYPLALQDYTRHLDVLKTTNFEEFEKQASFKFIESKKALEGGPPLYSYEYYCKLPNLGSCSSWQTRLFLYCELRLFELFTGNGRTISVDAQKGSSDTTGLLEYICPNVSIQDLQSLGPTAVIPLQCILPD